MARLFGTDGVRGLANQTLTAGLALKLGAAAAKVLTEDRRSHTRRPRAVIGRDPRVSGEMLAAALSAGIATQGVDVIRVGVLPTPAVAYLTGLYEADMGVVISASHNPMPDNGIKFFAAGGEKLDDKLEDTIEITMHTMGEAGPTGAEIGRIAESHTDGLDRYLEHLKRVVPDDLSGITVVVDAANGAASEAAPAAYAAAGATVIPIHTQADGYSINDKCGSTHLDSLKAAVRDHGADLGLAHDGDADRCLAIDASGEEVNGDQIMAILALAARDAGTLRNNTLVATVMSNLGLKLALEREGIAMHTTRVGDRYVLSDLRKYGHNLGGEQSGHIVMTDFATTGDGVLTGLFLMARMARTGQSLAELAAAMTVLPQVLINVAVDDKSLIAEDPAVIDAINAAEEELGGAGRVLLRPSGTEELFRVMVEAADAATAQRIADTLADVVARVGND